MVEVNSFKNNYFFCKSEYFNIFLLAIYNIFIFFWLINKEKFGELMKEYFKNLQGIIFVCDISSYYSFFKIKNYWFVKTTELL